MGSPDPDAELGPDEPEPDESDPEFEPEPDESEPGSEFEPDDPGPEFEYTGVGVWSATGPAAAGGAPVPVARAGGQHQPFV